MARLSFRNGLPALLLLLQIVGCGGNPRGRLPVSGKVSFRGKPLEKGTIDFRPVDKRSVGSGAQIVNSAYQIEELKGLPPGKYEVRVFSSKPDTSPLPEGVPPGVDRPWIELIPPNFNVQTEQMVEVTGDGPNEFVFEIPAR